MDVLVAEARVVRLRVSKGALQRGCFAPQVRREGAAWWVAVSPARAFMD